MITTGYNYLVLGETTDGDLIRWCPDVSFDMAERDCFIAYIKLEQAGYLLIRTIVKDLRTDEIVHEYKEDDE